MKVSKIKKILAISLTGMMMLAAASHAEEAIIPNEMVYVGHGP